jgi:hypothetical protein
LADNLGVKIILDYQKSYDSLQRVLERLSKTKINIQVSFGKNINTFTKDIVNLNNAIGNISEVNKKSIKNTNEMSQSLDKSSESFKKTTSHIHGAHGATLSFADEMKIALKRSIEWGLVMGTLYGSLRKLKEGVQFVYDLSNSMNQIRIVTGQSVEAVNKLKNSFNGIGIEMGASTKEIADTSVELYRQGLSQGEVEERMEAIVKYAKISNISLQDSNKIITATANATGESVNKIIDIFALLGRKGCPLIQ